MPCKFKCGMARTVLEYNIKPISGKNYSYDKGFKRCKVCSVSLLTSALYCPCCGYKLRTKPKNKKKIQHERI